MPRGKIRSCRRIQMSRGKVRSSAGPPLWARLRAESQRTSGLRDPPLRTSRLLSSTLGWILEASNCESRDDYCPPSKRDVVDTPFTGAILSRPVAVTRSRVDEHAETQEGPMRGLSGSENRSVGVQRWWRRGGHFVLPVLMAAVLLISAAGPAVADILIGGVAPLSQPGDVAGGQEMKWALEQAVADVNAKGGVLGQKIRLVFYDTQNKPDVCASVAKRLAQEDKVAAVVGEFHSGCALAQIPTYNQAGMPVVFSETYNDKITAGDPADPTLPPNPPTVFRIAPTSTYYSSFSADWIVNGVKAKKVVQVVDTTDYGVGAASAMKEALGKAGVKLAQVSVELAQPDYASIMTRLKNENPDAEVVYYDVSETATAYVVMQNGIDVGLSNAKNMCVGNPAM